MKKATFYHAGCPVCVNAEQELLNLVDSSKVKVEVVHLGEQVDQITTAENHGVKSVPALAWTMVTYCTSITVQPWPK